MMIELNVSSISRYSTKKFTPRKLKNWHKRDKTLKQWARSQLEGDSCEGSNFGGSLGVFLGKCSLLSYHLICQLEYSELTCENRPDSLLSNQHVREVTEGLSAPAKPEARGSLPRPLHSGVQSIGRPPAKLCLLLVSGGIIFLEVRGRSEIEANFLCKG